MAEARCRERWAHTSAVLALIANVHRDQRKKPTPYKPADFNPYQRRGKLPVCKASIDVLKRVFVDSQRRNVREQTQHQNDLEGAQPLPLPDPGDDPIRLEQAVAYLRQHHDGVVDYTL